MRIIQTLRLNFFKVHVEVDGDHLIKAKLFIAQLSTGNENEIKKAVGGQAPKYIAMLNSPYHATLSHVPLASKQQSWVYKRSAKTVPLHSPSPEGKLAYIQALIKAVNSEQEQTPVEILFEDESHFTNSPYIERGWCKRGKKNDSSP